MDTDLASLVPDESVIEEKTATAVGFYQIEVDSEVALEAGSEMLEKSWSLKSDGASSDVLLRRRLRTRMDTDLASLVPVEGVTEEKTETVVFPYMVQENH